MRLFLFANMAALTALACLSADAGGAGAAPPDPGAVTEPAATDPAATAPAADAAAAAAAPPAAKPEPKAKAPKAVKPAKPKEKAAAGPQHLVLTTSRVLGPAGKSLARGRVVLASAARAEGLAAKGWARLATADEVAHPEHPIVELVDIATGADD